MDNCIVTKETSIFDILVKLETLVPKIVYVCDNNKKVLGSITDGDIRRYALKNNGINGKAEDCMHSPCFTCTSFKQGLQLMDTYKIMNIPLVNNNGILIEIIERNSKSNVERIKPEFENVKIVMMAGGKGERLQPYTSVLPKPLIPISGIPIAERILLKYKESNLKHYIMSLNYKKNLIKTYFDDSMSDCNFVYVEENEPLGTGGSLRLMEEYLSDIFIVINCDMLIDINLNDLLDYHINNNAQLTMISAKKQVQIPYGVLNVNGNEIVSLDEKPTIEMLINTGMYVVNRSAIEYFPSTKTFHMTDLCESLIKNDQKVVTYTIDEEDCMDMGVISELNNMNEKVR